MPMTYREYMDKLYEMDELMNENKRKEQAAIDAMTEERNKKNRALYEEYEQKKRANDMAYRAKMRAASDVYKGERRKLYETKSVYNAQWRAQLTKIETGEIRREDIFTEEDEV